MQITHVGDTNRNWCSWRKLFMIILFSFVVVCCNLSTPTLTMPHPHISFPLLCFFFFSACSFMSLAHVHHCTQLGFIGCSAHFKGGVVRGGRALSRRNCPTVIVDHQRHGCLHSQILAASNGYHSAVPIHLTKVRILRTYNWFHTVK